MEEVWITWSHAPAKKGKGKPPVTGDILLTTQCMKKHPGFSHLQIYENNSFPDHLSKNRYFPTTTERLGGSSPGTSMAQHESHRVSVLGVGTSQCEAWPQGDQRQSPTETCCKANWCCKALCQGCCKLLWEWPPNMKHQPPSHFLCLSRLPFPKGLPQGCKSQNQQKKK